MTTDEQCNIMIANEQFTRGESLSDSDLDMLRNFYQKLHPQLAALGAEFWLAAHESLHRLHQLEGYVIARGYDEGNSRTDER